MPDIVHDFPVAVPAVRVFDSVSTPAGMDAWWTQRSSGSAVPGTTWELGFGPGYDWQARVIRSTPGTAFELEMTAADADWTGSRVSFDLTESGDTTQVRFAHRGWPSANEHYRVSSFCWAMYLRLLRRHLEQGETVPYERRLEV